MEGVPMGLDGTVHQPSVQLHPENIDLNATARLDAFTFVNGAGGIGIGDQSCIHPFSSVVGNGGLTMRERAVVTYGVQILTSSADLAKPASSVVPSDERKSISERVHLGRESFVGANAVLMPGVTVGEAGVVAAGTYCDRSVPPGMILYPDGTLRERPGDWPTPTPTV